MNNKLTPTFLVLLTTILALVTAACQSATSEPTATPVRTETAVPTEAATAIPPTATATPNPPTAAPSPTLAPTLEPTPVVLFSETFDSDRQGWAGTDANSVREIAQGQLSVELTGDHKLVMLPAPGNIPPDVDVTFEATVDRNADDNAGAIVGAMCRVRDTGDYYWAELGITNLGGGFSVYKSIAGSETEVIGPTASAAIREAGQPNSIRLVCSGEQLEFSVNGTVLADLTDADIDSGSVMLFTLGNPGASVTFDNFQVTLPEGSDPPSVRVESPAALNPGDVILETDFASLEGWTPLAFAFDTFKRTEDFTAETGANGLYVEIPQKNTSVYAFHDGYPGQSDVQIDLDVETVAGPNRNNISLVCRSTPRGWYEFAMHSGGLWAVYRYEYGKDYALLDSGASTAIHLQKAKNHLTVTCLGDELSFYVNDVKLTSVKDALFVDGSVGVSVSTFDISGAGVEFESLAVTVPDPANPPGGAVAPTPAPASSAGGTPAASASAARIFVSAITVLGDWCSYSIGVSGFQPDESLTWTMIAPNGETTSFPGILNVNQSFLFTPQNPLGDYVLTLQGTQNTARLVINWTGACS